MNYQFDLTNTSVVNIRTRNTSTAYPQNNLKMSTIPDIFLLPRIKWLYPILLMLVMSPYQLFCDIAVSPSSAHAGDSVTVTCSNLDYLDTDYLDGLVFYGIKFIVGDSSNYLSLSQVNSGTGNPLYRITAQSQISTGLGILTLNPFQSPDDGLLIGCVGLYQSSEGSDYVNKETTNLQAAETSPTEPSTTPTPTTTTPTTTTPTTTTPTTNTPTTTTPTTTTPTTTTPSTTTPTTTTPITTFPTITNITTRSPKTTRDTSTSTATSPSTNTITENLYTIAGAFGGSGFLLIIILICINLICVTSCICYKKSKSKGKTQSPIDEAKIFHNDDYIYLNELASPVPSETDPHCYTKIYNLTGNQLPTPYENLK